MKLGFDVYCGAAVTGQPDALTFLCAGCGLRASRAWWEAGELQPRTGDTARKIRVKHRHIEAREAHEYILTAIRETPGITRRALRDAGYRSVNSGIKALLKRGLISATRALRGSPYPGRPLQSRWVAEYRVVRS